MIDLKIIVLKYISTNKDPLTCFSVGQTDDTQYRK